MYGIPLYLFSLLFHLSLLCRSNRVSAVSRPGGRHTGEDRITGGAMGETHQQNKREDTKTEGS